MTGVPRAIIPYDPFRAINSDTVALLTDLPCINVTDSPYNVVDDWGGTGIGTDNTSKFQAAFADAAARKRAVYIPGAVNGYRITAPLIALGAAYSGLLIFGDGANSAIINDAATDAIQLGDGITNVPYVVILGIGIQSLSGTGWGINANKAQYILVERCVLSTPFGIQVAACDAAKVINNIIGSLKGTGTGVLSTSNVVKIYGNTIGGTAGQLNTTGINVGSTKAVVQANSAETLGTGIDVSSSGADVIGNYFESNTTVDITARVAASAFRCAGNMHASTAVAVAIDVAAIDGVEIGTNWSNVGAEVAGTGYSTGFIRIADGAKNVSLARQRMPYQNAGGTAVNTGGPVAWSGARHAEGCKELTGDLTVSRNIFRVRAGVGASSRYTLRYYLQYKTTESSGTKNQVYGQKSWTATLNSSGVWTTDTAVVNDITEQVQAPSQGAAVLTVGFLNGDKTGGLIVVTCTSYNDATSSATFFLHVETGSVCPTVDSV